MCRSISCRERSSGSQVRRNPANPSLRADRTFRRRLASETAPLSNEARLRQLLQVRRRVWRARSVLGVDLRYLFGRDGRRLVAPFLADVGEHGGNLIVAPILE